MMKMNVCMLCVCIGLIGLPSWADASPPAGDSLLKKVEQIEQRLDARVGVMVRDEETERVWSYKADERFPMASTFKALACAALLSRVDAGEERLDRTMLVEKADLVSYSPILEERVGEKMTLEELCEATLTLSDNTAANYIVEAIGSPSALTEIFRSWGDPTTRLDRWETEMNTGTPGDPRDTTSPEAMAKTLRGAILGDTLAENSRRRLTTWLRGNRVGDALMRAGVPDDWIVADRTGAGGHGTRGNAAIFWPPNRKPVVAVVYITETEAAFEVRNAAIAEIGEEIAATILSINPE